MAKEAKRGCGYRKVGGIYLVSGQLSEPCHRLPFELGVCPVCGSGIKQSRGWTWIDGHKMFSPSCTEKVESGTVDAKTTPEDPKKHCPRCAVCTPKKLGDRTGLLWVGEKFYPTPGHFTREAAEMGVSKRIKAVPHDFVLGKTWILLAHPKAIKKTTVPKNGNGKGKLMEEEFLPAVFSVFRPERIEIIITKSQSEDPEFMKGLEKRGLTPVVVPDNDPDHNPKGIGTDGNGDDE